MMQTMNHVMEMFLTSSLSIHSHVAPPAPVPGGPSPFTSTSTSPTTVVATVQVANKCQFPIEGVSPSISLLQRHTTTTIPPHVGSLLFLLLPPCLFSHLSTPFPGCSIRITPTAVIFISRAPGSHHFIIIAPWDPAPAPVPLTPCLLPSTVLRTRIQSCGHIGLSPAGK